VGLVYFSLLDNHLDVFSSYHMNIFKGSESVTRREDYLRVITQSASEIDSFLLR
jgi:hypothetical protein